MPFPEYLGTDAAKSTNNSSSNSLKESTEKLTAEHVQHGVLPDNVHHRQVLEFLKTLPSKNYGDATLNENSAAIFGNVYQFYDSQSSEQRSVLQDMQKSVQELCQKQDYRDSQIVHLHRLLGQFKAVALSKELEQQTENLDQLVKIKPERNPDVDLEECVSVAIARQFTPDLCVDTISYFAELDEWLIVRGSAVLLVQGDMLAQDATRDLAVVLTRSLRESSYPVAWCFPHQFSECSHGAEQVLRSLVYQLVRLIPDLVTDEITSNESHEPQYQILLEELAGLFCRALRRVPRCFLVVEFPVHQPNMVDQLTGIFACATKEAQLHGGVLKVLLAHHGPTKRPTASMTHVKFQECSLLATPMPLARARQQSIRMNNDLISSLTNVVLTAD